VNFGLPVNLQGFKDRLKLATANLPIKIGGKPLEVHVSRIHHLAKIAERIRVDEAVGMANIKEARFFGKKTDVQHIFAKYSWFYISICDGTGAHLLCLFDNELRRNIIVV
jgi:hypothetical protein